MAEELNRELAASQGAEEALRRSEKLHRAIVEQARDVIFTFDANGQHHLPQPDIRAHRRLACGGMDRPRLHGADLRGGRGPGPPRSLGSLPDVGILPLRRAVICGKDRRIVFEVSLVNLAVDGEDIGFLGLARDVTERDRAEVQLRRSERMLAESQTGGQARQLGARPRTAIRSGGRTSTTGCSVSIPPRSRSHSIDSSHSSSPGQDDAIRQDRARLARARIG